MRRNWRSGTALKLVLNGTRRVVPTPVGGWRERDICPEAAANTKQRARAECSNRGRVSSRAVALLMIRSFLLCLGCAGGALLLVPNCSAAGLQEPGAPSKWTEGSSTTVSPAPQAAVDGPKANTGGAPAPLTEPALARASSASYQGRIVSSVEFQGVSLTDEAGTYLQQLAVKTGEPLNRTKLADSVRALYATGRFADLAVEAEPHGSEGVDLIYRATPNYFVGVVSASGAPGAPSDAQLADASRLRLGELYSQSAVDHAVQLMKSLLLENGYYQSSVSVQDFPDAATQQVELRFQVEAGAPAKVGDVTVQGDSGYTPEEIRNIAHLHQGDTVTADRTSRALERLRDRYSHENRLEAQIALTDRKFHPDSNTLDYLFHIERGPTVAIDVLGANVSHGKLRQLLPVYTEHALDDDLLNEGRKNLRDYFQTRGYFDADVQFRRDYAGNHLRVVYMVERGERHQLVNVAIHGNRYFSSELIRERMQIKQAGWLASYGHFSQELLDQDVQSILDLYHSNGFQQAQVHSDIKDDLNGVSGRMEVDMNIDEGAQTRVASLKIEGAEKVKPEDLLPLLTTAEGQPYSSSNIATDRDLIMNYYFNRGFSQVSFEASATPQPGDPQRMNVVYHVKEGEQVFVDRILMSGLDNTKPGVAERQFQFQSGEPLSQTAMLETQRRLYDLGVFNEVKLAVQNSEGDAKYKNILLQFTEARRWTFNYGVGIEIESASFGARTSPNGQTGISPTVSFDVSRLNVGGRAHTLSFKSHVGRLQQQGLATYEAPRLLNHQNLRLAFNLFYDNSLNVQTFTSRRLEGSIQLEQSLSRITTLLYRFTYRRVQASELQIDPASDSSAIQSGARGAAQHHLHPRQARRSHRDPQRKLHHHRCRRGLRRVWIGGKFWPPVGPEFYLSAVSPTALGFRPLYRDWNCQALRRSHRRRPHGGAGDSAAGTVLCRGRQRIAGLWPQSGRTSRPADRTGAGRRGRVCQQPGAANASAGIALRGG